MNRRFYVGNYRTGAQFRDAAHVVNLGSSFQQAAFNHAPLSKP
jgi:hypothetical protein